MVPLEWYCEAGINTTCLEDLRSSASSRKSSIQIGSYALICMDLHPIANQWVHLYIPKIAIEKSTFNNTNLASVSQSIIGKNSFGDRGYGGPQPPKGTGKHKYVFYLFALDSSVNVPRSEENECKNVDQFINMVGKEHILSYTTLSGFYEEK